MLRTFLAQLLAATSLMYSLKAQDTPFKKRQSWDGPYKIQMVGAPNLEPVYVNPQKAALATLKVDSIVKASTIKMTGDLISINNRYKGGAPFMSVEIPLPALLCPNPNDSCYKGLSLTAPSALCNPKYDNNALVTKLIGMTYADYDKDVTTYSATMANMPMANNAQVVAAYLYWSGNFKSIEPHITLDVPTNSYTGSGQVFDVLSTSNIHKSIKLRTENSAYTNVTATSTMVSNHQYVCMAEVTGLLKDFTGGEIWVANLPTYPMQIESGTCSGWNIVLVTTAPQYTSGHIELLDGIQNIVAHVNLQIPIKTKNKGEVPLESYVGVAVLDGENLYSQLATPGSQENLVIRPLPSGPTTNVNPYRTDQPHYKLWTKKGYPAKADGSDNINTCKAPLFDALWASVYDGFSSSHISSYSLINNKNGNEIKRLPAHENTLGLDIHHIKLPENTFPIETDSALISISAGAQGYNIVYMLYTATGGEVVTSLDDAQQDNETHIMPHPLTHQSQIMLNPAFGSAHIHIYDLSGRIAAQYYNVMDYITIQKSDFQPGMYMVRVNQGTHTTIKKLLVE